MSEPQLFQTRMGRQYYEVTLPELVRQLARLNDMLALGVEFFEKKISSEADSCKCENCRKSAS